MKGRLYVCATPIGNLEDVTHRLLRILGEADVVAAEDTRLTRKILSRYEIKAKVVSYNDQNELTTTPRLLDRMASGDTVALVTDSGTPTISDPGYRLVSGCIERDIPVVIVPGPSAPIAALAVSGLPTARFAFEGFLPRKEGELKGRIEKLAGDQRTLIFFEAPGRVTTTLRVMLGVLGDRRMALARELTKAHEQVIRGTISEVIAVTSDSPVLGEVVVLVEGAQTSGDLQAAVADAKKLGAEGMPPSKAAAQSARRFGVSKKEVYQALLSHSAEKGSQD